MISLWNFQIQLCRKGFWTWSVQLNRSTRFAWDKLVDSDKSAVAVSLIICWCFYELGRTCEEFEAYLDSIRFDRLRFSGEEYARALRTFSFTDFGLLGLRILGTRLLSGGPDLLSGFATYKQSFSITKLYRSFSEPWGICLFGNHDSPWMCPERR